MQRRITIVLAALLLLGLMFGTNLRFAGPVWADTGSESTGADSTNEDVGLSGTDYGTVNTPTAAEVAAAAALGLNHCSNYQQVQRIVYGGIEFVTKANVCAAYYGRDGGAYKWGPVARFKCYRNGVQFGNATGGCRWAGSLSNYEQKSSPHRYTSFYRRPGSISAAYWDDSGRIYGAYSSYYGGYAQNHCQDSWGGYYYNIVHYHGTTGTDIGIYNMIDTCTPWFYATATP